MTIAVTTAISGDTYTVCKFDASSVTTAVTTGTARIPGAAHMARAATAPHILTAPHNTRDQNVKVHARATGAE